MISGRFERLAEEGRTAYRWSLFTNAVLPSVCFYIISENNDI